MGDIKKRCVIVSGSPEYDIDFLKANLRSDDFVICADAGADRILTTGRIPDLLVGDFDSSKSCGVFKNVETVKLPVMKDDTDTQHCAEIAVERGYKEILLLCATGGRLDHTLANLSVLYYLKNRSCKGRIADRFSDIMLLESGENTLGNVKGKTISVMPFLSKKIVLSYEGMLYPLKNETVFAEYPYSISNVAEEDSVSITLHEGEALVIISNDG